MKLHDFGTGTPDRPWFQRVLEFTRNKISFVDNLDGQFVTTNIAVTETEVGHSLGRIPLYVLEIAAYPNGTAGISFTKAPTNNQLFLKRTVAGPCTLFVM